MAARTSLFWRRICAETINESRKANVPAMYGHAV
jgi:hypothetical protein